MEATKALLAEARAMLLAKADDLSMGSPVMELCDRIDAAIGPARISDVIQQSESPLLGGQSPRPVPPTPNTIECDARAK